MRYQDIEKYTTWGSYHVDVAFSYLEAWIIDNQDCLNLELNPDFQRGHVWDNVQRTKYVEHVLKGGNSGVDVFFNCPSWQNRHTTDYTDMVCVDGLQRITAIRKYMNNEIPVFGHSRVGMVGPLPLCARLSVYVNDLQTKAEVLKWYLDLNSGGVVHTEGELNRVRAMLEEETDGNKRF